MKKLPLIPFPLWSQFGISVISALLLISCVWSHDPSTCGLAPKGAQDSLRLSLQPDSLSHHFSLTSCEIRPFLVALSMTSVSFSLCSLPCSAAPRGLLSPASSGQGIPVSLYPAASSRRSFLHGKGNYTAAATLMTF